MQFPILRAALIASTIRVEDSEEERAMVKGAILDSQPTMISDDRFVGNIKKYLDRVVKLADLCRFDQHTNIISSGQHLLLRDQTSPV